MLKYPWQWPSAAAAVDLQWCLPAVLDEERLAADLRAVMRTYVPSLQDGPHHNGGWKRLGLICPDGDPHQAHLLPGQVNRRSPVLDLMPYVRDVLGDLPFPIWYAVLSSMEPGARVRWHRDYDRSLDGGKARFHIPIRTSPQARLEIGHQRCRWTPGRIWYGDFTFPHRVANDGPAPRVHIILDVAASDAVKAVCPPQFLDQTPRRKMARKMAALTFDFSEKLHAEGRYAARVRAERDRGIRNNAAAVHRATALRRKPAAPDPSPLA